MLDTDLDTTMLDTNWMHNMLDTDLDTIPRIVSVDTMLGYWLVGMLPGYDFGYHADRILSVWMYIRILS